MLYGFVGIGVKSKLASYAAEIPRNLMGGRNPVVNKKMLLASQDIIFLLSKYLIFFVHKWVCPMTWRCQLKITVDDMSMFIGT
jgi:hypothetical protein